MNVSTPQTESAWHGVQTLESVSIEGVIAQSASLSTLMQSGGSVDAVRFRCRLEIPGLLLVPEQDCAASLITNGILLFENKPKDSWPRFSIQTVSDCARISVWPSDNTVNAELLNTRVRFALETAGLCSIYAIESGIEFKCVFNNPSASENQKLLYRAMLCRKLKYIEQVFGISFLLPDEISTEQVQIIDRVFRGLTEGEFTTRAADILFEDISLSSVDLNRPPFSGPGPFSRDVGSKQRLFDKLLPVGPVSVRLERAELANPRVIDQVERALNQGVSIRLELLDNQITHRFETYANLSRKQRIQPLEMFKQELAREEPKELVDLIDEPLQGNVSSREASSIAVGWTQYNDLPDRYCPQEPEHDVTAGKWRVPIYLVYANGEGGPVGEVVIDEKTGVIVSHTLVDELRNKGRALAEQILHA